MGSNRSTCSVTRAAARWCPETPCQGDLHRRLGDQWEEFVHHPRVLDWMQVTGKDDPAESPCRCHRQRDRLLSSAFACRRWCRSTPRTASAAPSTCPPRQLWPKWAASAWKPGKGLKGICRVPRWKPGRCARLLRREEELGQGTGTAHHVSRRERLEADIPVQQQTEPWLAVCRPAGWQAYEIFTGRANGGFELPGWVSSGWVVAPRPTTGQQTLRS